MENTKICCNARYKKDIERLLSKEVLELYNICVDNDKRNRIERITKMLDLTDHLLHFSKYLTSINKPTERIEGGKKMIDDHVCFEGHDYSGCEYDIDALVYYLYVSIIDTSMAKTSVYKKPEDFLNEQIKESDVSKTKV